MTGYRLKTGNHLSNRWVQLAWNTLTLSPQGLNLGVICYKRARLETLRVFFGKVVVLSGTKNVLQEDGIPLPHFISCDSNKVVYLGSNNVSPWNLDAFEYFMRKVVPRVPSDHSFA
jgi:hypothetical protein